MPAARARDWNGDKADILAAFDGWAPEVVEAIERTPADAIISVPAQDRPFLKQWGRGPITPAGRRRAPDADQQVTRRQLRGGGRLRAGGGDRPHTRCGRGPARIRGQAPRPRRNARAEFAAAQQSGAGPESGRLCGAESRDALCADAIADPAHDPSHAIRPGVDGVTRTEVRRPLSPVERWFWIADQVSPLNVIARVRLVGHLPEGVLGRAAAALAAEYPLLRVAIRADADGTNPAFVPSSQSIPVRTVRGDDMRMGASSRRARTRVRRWIGAADHCCASSTSCWDSPEEAHDLVLTVSHVIADGTTALSLLRRLIERGGGHWRRSRIAAHRRSAGRPSACTLSWPAGNRQDRRDRIGRWDLPQRWPGRAGSHRSPW